MQMNQITLKKFSREEIASMITEWRKSGKSRTLYAAEKGISYFAFVRWIRKLDCKHPAPKSKGFVQLPTIITPSVFAELQLNCGHKIIFYQPFPSDYFHKLR